MIFMDDFLVLWILAARLYSPWVHTPVGATYAILLIFGSLNTISRHVLHTWESDKNGRRSCQFLVADIW